MKTTLNLDDSLIANAKATATQLHTTLTRLIEEGLRLRLQPRQASARPVVLPVYHGEGGLVPGLDGLSNKAMLDAADE